jgi:hypothetical protein
MKSIGSAADVSVGIEKGADQVIVENVIPTAISLYGSQGMIPRSRRQLDRERKEANERLSFSEHPVSPSSKSPIPPPIPSKTLLNW